MEEDQRGVEETKKSAAEDELLSLVGTDIVWRDFGYYDEYEEHMAKIMEPYVYKLMDDFSFYPGTTKISISEGNREERIYFVMIYDDMNTGNYAGFYVNLNTEEVTFSQNDSNIVFN